ncbi:AMP-binding protein [Rhodococcus opacus]|nr:AMP-binding protein [Rhodococcus opacus]
MLSAQLAELREQYYRSGLYGEQTMAQAIERGGIEFADDPIVFIRGEQRRESTIGELYRDAESFAAGLRAHGIGDGDRVAVQLPNSPECYVAHLGILLAGATLLPIIPIYGLTEVEFILRQSAARALIMPTRLGSINYSVRVPALRAIGTLDNVIVVGDEVPPGCVPWSAVQQGHRYTRPVGRSDDVCLLLYTSGTTSEPKGVLHTHNSLIAELNNSPIQGRGDADYVNLVAFPAGHIAGVINICGPAVLGGSSVFMDAWRPALAAELIARYNVTSTSGTPFHLQGLIEAADGTDQLATLRGFLLGAATVTDDLVQRATTAGIVTYRTYGATEHPTITACTLDDPLTARLETEGGPLPGCQVQIVDESGIPVPTGTQGEIVVRGPDQFIGYQDPALTAAAYYDGGWFRTGDLGHLDIDGRLHITDRLKDIVIRGGENISSLEVENILATHHHVLEAAVIALPDTRYGEIVCAVIVVEPGTTITLEDIRSHFAASGSARQKCPERLVLLDELPRTALGKIRKADLRQQIRTENPSGTCYGGSS